MPSITERVKNGARWLDESFPGWEVRVNHNTLDMSDGSQCICGQVFADQIDNGIGYEYAETLFSEANSWISAIVNSEPIPYDAESTMAARRASAVSRALGFMGETTEEFNELRDAWEQLLAERYYAS